MDTYFGHPCLPTRFWDQVFVSPNGCWLWIGAIGTGGYGNCMIDGRVQNVHRITLGRFRVIEGGKVADHLCRQRSCCNPDHLEQVSNQENTIRGASADANRRRGAALTSCPHGHRYSGDNLKIDRHGRRSCRTCAINAGRRRRSRQATSSTLTPQAPEHNEDAAHG
ncbi:HNH endonuclease [Sphingomonas sp.]|uniref:HNH endonuclease n=1 Tax=Sphingomonas sp. TaxID=28214 RepID=UPI003B00D268